MSDSNFNKKHFKIFAIVTLILVAAIIAMAVRGKNIVDAKDQALEQQKQEREANQDNSEINSVSPEKVLAISDIDVVIGDPNAPITMYEFLSYSCSHCASFALNVFPKLKEEFIDTGKMKVIIRDFPLDEPSLRASQLTRCVPKESFESLHKVLFEQRKKWAYTKDFPEKLENIAKILGMSGEKFHQCMADRKLEEEILQSRLDAAKAFSINSTPTIIIQGKKYIGENSYEKVAEYINSL